VVALVCAGGTLAACGALQRKIVLNHRIIEFLVIPERREETGPPCPPALVELVRLAVTGLLQLLCHPLYYLASTTVREEEPSVRELLP